MDGEATHQKTKKKVMIQEVSDSEESEEEEEEEQILELGGEIAPLCRFCQLRNDFLTS